MQSVKYARASTVDEAVSLLSDNGSAYVLAGGTDLIVAARERTRQVDLLVDVKHIPEVMAISFNADAGLTIGAATPCYQLYNNAEIKQHYPCVVDSASLIGGTAIQGRASLGGNLCNSGPAADSIPSQIVLEGVATVAGPNGRREVAVEDFCTGPGTNVLGQGEFVVSLHFPAPKPNSGARFLRFIPRNEMDIAVVNAAASLQLDGDTVTQARIAIGAVAPTPLFVAAAGEALVGKPLSDETIVAAAAAARDAATPIDDMRGSIVQRKHLTGVLTERVIRGAANRARGVEA
ncbi:MAG TPA: xanthine dehydrogenase family protein subunit M [Dehalococcoidia bacterium]|nr:xanthine dehydrogenase family protein subunit M [Dehalococcoidia bacterium]